MTVKIAINGFGRIGRNILRAVIESGREDLEIIAINDLGSTEVNAHLLEFDSIHGKFSKNVKTTKNSIIIGDMDIEVTAIKQPADLPWTNIDDIHRMRLDELIRAFGLTGLSEIEKENFNKAWHRLTPWPDAVGGLSRLKEKFIISTLSNGNISLLTNMAKNAGLPWDVVLSAELAKRYKPDPEAYLTAVDLLGLEPEQVMMVATHPSDLRAAARVGLRTAYVIRPLERGPNPSVDTNVAGEFDYTASDFLDLAVQLGV